MTTLKIKTIADKISKRYGMIDSLTGKALVIATRLSRNKIELRTELTSYEGGQELSDTIDKKYPEWICEAQGGCVYIVYRPQ